MDIEPLISIGMPVLNNEKTLAVALQSILKQTYSRWELLLIDDGSSDGTSTIARRFACADNRIRFVSHKDTLNISVRLNQAVALSRGEYFARMDGDDVSYPRRFELQLKYLQSHPEVDVVSAEAVVFEGDGIVLGKRPAPEDHANICARPHAGLPLIHPLILARMNYFRRYSYQLDAIRCEDQILYITSMLDSSSNHPKVRFANIPQILYGFREEGLFVKKQLYSRCHLAVSGAKLFFDFGDPISALRLVVGQLLKGTCDIVALTTGLKYRLLRHRARPTTQAERLQWEDVWRELKTA
jgi:glycosyltransferase involved in cell wall biosynthesis